MHPRILVGGVVLSLTAACGTDKNPLAIDEAQLTPKQFPNTHVQLGTFFMSWSWPGNVYTSPIPTQPYDVSQCPENPNAPCLNPSVYRQQWNDVWDWQSVADWALSNPGHLYIVGDEVDHGGFGDRYTNSPSTYADEYCAFVRNVRLSDPYAAFSPSGFSHLVQDWWLNDFVSWVLILYQGGNCSSSYPIGEWTFHKFGNWSQGLSGFMQYVNDRAAWAVSRPAPLGQRMVLGAWTLGWVGDDVPNDDPAYVARLREAKAALFQNKNIKLSRYFAFEPWPAENPEPHPLADAAGNLNATGQAYAEVTGRINGPTVVRPSVPCSWSAQTTGGPPPYTYQWWVNYVPVTTSEWLDYTNLGSGFVLQMRVTDGNGAQSMATINVSVSSSAPTCLF
jgi:hypothetical protein